MLGHMTLCPSPFQVDHTLMQPYFNTFAALLHDNLPKLSTHFSKLQFSPEYYLIEWYVSWEVLRWPGW